MSPALPSVHPKRKRRHELKGKCAQCGVRWPRPNRRTCARCVSVINRQQAARYRLLREGALDAYGRTCANPECTTPKATLTIDHMDGRGADHWAANKIRNTFQFYAWLLRNNWPDGYQVLCRPCNASKGASAAVSAPAPVRRQSTLFDRDRDAA